MITGETFSALDTEDPLAGFRDQFDLPEGIVYLDGNSLGPLPRRTLARMIDTMREQWGQSLIRSWNDHDWIGLPQRVGDKIARLVGAAPGEIVAADSTSVNLFKLLAAACAMRPDRGVILTEVGNFPTDVYIMEGLISMLGAGYELRRVERDDIADAVDSSIAVVALTHVDYRSGELHDMADLNEAAAAAGALNLWDLSHSAGAVPVDLNAAATDFAVGCGYKYLNGGPGAPAYLYVAKRHQAEAHQPLSGWMGHAAPFAFEGAYRPADGIARHLCGTPGVLAMAALEEGVDLMLEADMKAVRRKSVLLSETFAALVEANCAGYGLALASPRDPARRASQVSFRHPEAHAIVQALIARGVIGDFRAPDILRFGIAPLYLRYADIAAAAQALHEVMESDAWDRPEYRTRAAVT